MNFETVKLVDNRVIDDQDNDLGNLLDFLESFSELVGTMKMELTNYTNVHTTPALRNKLKNDLKHLAEEHFINFFKEKGEATPFEIDKEASKLIDQFTQYGDELHEEILRLIDERINKNKNKVNGGDNMFKSLKEARNFTAHLDALANEIEGLEGIGTEMRKHLAYRLDRLSDLIESTSKEASISKEANGLGQGAWAYDEDEARYMTTMGGTGALEKDEDEPYMDRFKGDDHMEVLNRQENLNINGGGVKVKQPSDDYKEAPVANKLRETILKVLKNK